MLCVVSLQEKIDLTPLPVDAAGFSLMPKMTCTQCKIPVYKKQTNETCGAIIAQLTCKLLQDCCCTDQVVNIASDTTPSNTGRL